MSHDNKETIPKFGVVSLQPLRPKAPFILRPAGPDRDFDLYSKCVAPGPNRARPDPAGNGAFIVQNEINGFVLFYENAYVLTEIPKNEFSFKTFLLSHKCF